MKKNLVRIVALLLVAMLALTLLPMGAFAVSNPSSVWVFSYGHNATDPNYYDYHYNWLDIGINPKEYLPGETIKRDDLPSYVEYGSNSYDFLGFLQNSSFEKTYDKFHQDHYPSMPSTEEEWNKYYADLKALGAVPVVNQDLKVPSTQAEWDEWKKTFSANYPDFLEAIYGLHQHRLTCWISDGTTHWRNCTVCKEQFIGQNWCQDGDEDRICNVCGGDVPYHDVTVIEDEGGKITVNKDLASHRTKITADVEVNEGYKLKKLHFTKIRDDGSRQEITRYKKNGQFWTRMPTYELEVSAEFVKK